MHCSIVTLLLDDLTHTAVVVAAQSVNMTFSCCGERRKPDRADDVVRHIFHHMKPSKAMGQSSCSSQPLPPSWQALLVDVTDEQWPLAQQQEEQQRDNLQGEDGQHLLQGEVPGCSSPMQQGLEGQQNDGHAADTQAQQPAGTGQGQQRQSKRKRQTVSKELRSAALTGGGCSARGSATVIEAPDGRKYMASQACRDLFMTSDYVHLSDLARDVQLQLAQHIVAEGAGGGYSNFLPYAQFVVGQVRCLLISAQCQHTMLQQYMDLCVSSFTLDINLCLSAHLQRAMHLSTGGVLRYLAVPQHVYFCAVKLRHSSC